MITKYNEIEGIVEDLLEGTILEIFQSELQNAKEVMVAIEILKQKLEEIDEDIIDELFV